MARQDLEISMKVDQGELDAMTQAILDASRIYVAGWGRAGLTIRVLSMDCSQMGLRTHIVGDASTPAVKEGDLVVIGSGSGETETMKVIAARAKKFGAKLGLITGKRDSSIGQLADYEIYIPRPEEEKGHPDMMGGSFYHVVVMVCDLLRGYAVSKGGIGGEKVDAVGQLSDIGFLFAGGGDHGKALLCGLMEKSK